MPLSPAEVQAMFGGQAAPETTAPSRAKTPRPRVIRAISYGRCKQCNETHPCLVSGKLPGTTTWGMWCQWCWIAAETPQAPGPEQLTMEGL